MRLLFLLLFPTTLLAETVTAPFPVALAEVFPEGARVEAQARVTLPEGEHRIELLVPPTFLRGVFEPRVEGARLELVEIGENTRHAPDVFDLPAQAVARDVVAEAEARLREAQGAEAALLGEIAALDASAAYLRGLGGGEGFPDAEALGPVARAIGAELAEIARARVAVEAGRVPLTEDRVAATEALKRAEQGLALLGPPTPDWDLVALLVTLEAPGDVVVSHTFFDPFAGWSVSYGAELGDEGISIERRVEVRQGGEVPWIAADVALSTALQGRAMEASRVDRDIAQIFDPRDEAVEMEPASPRMATEPVVAEPVMEAAASFAAADFDGPAVRYVLPRALTLPAGGEVSLALAPLSLPAERYLAAAPRFDLTAFHMADFENTSGEPLLPGPVRLFRDGGFVGESFLPAVAAGAEGTLGFGPEPGVALSFRVLDEQSGDRGIIRGQRVREVEVRLSADNLGDEARAVRLRYAVPSSQQEDLVVRVEAAPAPTTRDVEDRIGVMEWALDLAPGAGEQIALTFDLRWPEDQVLGWRP